VDEDGSSENDSLSLVRGVLTGRVGCAGGVAEATCLLKSLGGAFGATPPPLASARRRCLRLASLSNQFAHTLQRTSSEFSAASRRRGGEEDGKPEPKGLWPAIAKRGRGGLSVARAGHSSLP